MSFTCSVGTETQTGGKQKAGLAKPASSKQQSPALLAPRTSFMEDSFSTEQVGGGDLDDFKMV